MQIQAEFNVERGRYLSNYLQCFRRVTTEKNAQNKIIDKKKSHSCTSRMEQKTYYSPFSPNLNLAVRGD